MYNAEQKKIIKAVEEWCKKQLGVELSETDTAFYTPEEWKDRGEIYCLNAKLVMTYEGIINSVMNMHYGHEDFDSFCQLTDSLGLFFEQGTHWFGGFYE